LSEYFTQTSDEPYDKHYYTLHMQDGSWSNWVDYEKLRDHWMTHGGEGMSHVEVRGYPRPKPKAKGF
jgi:hypothetical protein